MKHRLTAGRVAVWFAAVAVTCQIAVTAAEKQPARAGLQPEPCLKELSVPIRLLRQHGESRCGLALPATGGLIIDPREHDGDFNLVFPDSGVQASWRQDGNGDLLVVVDADILAEPLSYRIRTRFGDVNGDDKVDAADVELTKAHNGQAVTDETCRYDINLDGRINLVDVARVKSAMGL